MASFKGDLVWIQLRPECLPPSPFAKLTPKTDGHLRIIKWIEEIFHMIELPRNANISVMFNVSNLSPYYPNDPLDIKDESSPTQETWHGVFILISLFIF